MARVTRTLLASREEKVAALQTLGLQPSSEYAAAKSSFRSLVVRLHPDMTRRLEQKERLKREEKFKEVAAAFTLLDEMNDKGEWHCPSSASTDTQDDATPPEDTAWWNAAEGPAGESYAHVGSQQWLALQQRRVVFAVRTLKKQKKSQHIPVPRETLEMVSLEVVAGWAADEMRAQNLRGYTILAHETGPMGVPCVSITGTPSRKYHTAGAEREAAEAAEEEAAQRREPFSLLSVYRRVVRFMMTPI